MERLACRPCTSFSRTVRWPFRKVGFQPVHGLTAWLVTGALLVPVCSASLPALTQLGLPAFLQKVSLAFNSAGSQPASLTLYGTVELIAGLTDENGTVQLKSSSDGSVSETWTLPTQSHSVTQGPLRGPRACTYTDAALKSHGATDLNCLRVVPWFAPWLATGLIGPALTVASDTTTSADSASGLERLFFVPNVTYPTGTTMPPGLTLLPQLAGASITYDSVTALPAALEYSQIIDSEPSHSLVTRVVFSDYRLESGYLVPHHLQRFVQRTLQADVHITSVTAE